MQGAASQTADDDGSSQSTETVTSPSVVTVPSAGAGFESHCGDEFFQSKFPGLRIIEGRDIDADDVKEVIGLLKQAGIPACVVGVYALRYFGAGRISNEWDICVPDEQLDLAQEIFHNDIRFKQTRPPPPLITSLRHTRTTFILKNVQFVFILVPASDHFVDPNCFELSRQGIPYPKLHHFARSLLVLQDGANLCDFIDGMDLDEEWAESNLDFDNLQVEGLEYSRKRNAIFEEKDLGGLLLNHDYRSFWNQQVGEKEKRIEPMRKGRYKTQWRRIKNDIDPRLRDRGI